MLLQLKAIYAFIILLSQLSLNNITVNEKISQQITINQEVFIFVDSTSQFQLKEIRERFTTVVPEEITVEDSIAYWLNFTLENQSSYWEEISLEIGKIDSAQLFIDEGEEQVQKVELGRMMPSINKGYQWGSWDITWYNIVIPKKKKINIFIRCKNISGMPADIKLNFIDPSDKEFTTNLVNLSQGVFQGFMLMMFILGIIFFLYSRHFGYLYFSFYSLLMAISYISVYGYTRYLLGDFAKDYLVWAFFSQLGAVSYMQFIRIILKVKTVSLKLDNLIIILIFLRFIGLLSVLYYSIIDLNLSVVQNTILLIDTFSAIVGMIAIIYLISKGNLFAQYALFGTALLIVGVVFAIMSSMGIINIRAEYFTQLGVILQCIVLSIGLSNEIRDRAKGEIKAKAELISLKEEINKELELKVKNRTFELKIASDAIEQKNKELSLKNERIESSLRAANTIQNAILFDEELLKTFFKSYFILNKAKDVVSGDFFWLTQMESGKIILVVADCTGHGVPGALMTMISHILLDKIIKLWKITSPNEILETLHLEIHHVLRQDKTGDRNGVDASIICIEKNNDKKLKIAFCGARNHLYYSIPSQKKIAFIAGSRKGVGGKQDPEKSFDKHTIEVESDAFLYLGSDGLIDQPNVQRRKFGKQKLEGLLKEVMLLPAEEQVSTIVTALNEHMQLTTQRDDILWLGIQL